MPIIKYLLRLDDASPFMDIHKWEMITDIIDLYNIKPLVGIVPNNQDPNIQIEHNITRYQSLLSKWKANKWKFALHGYDHVYLSESGGINPIHKRSEFAGLDYKLQYEKLKRGYDLLIKQGIEPEYFYAPSHTFDDLTIAALKAATPIRIISDTFATRPYLYKDITIIPQQIGIFRAIKLPGIWTFCYHPNSMKECDLLTFEMFCKKYHRYFISFAEIPTPNKGKGILDRFLSSAYFEFRKISR